MSKTLKVLTGLALRGVALAIATAGIASAEVPRLVTRTVDDAQRVTLAGNTRSEARAAYDRGVVADSLKMDHMQLLLQRPPETEAALVAYITALHDPSSPLFHHWLTASRLGAEYGPAAEDVRAVSIWLGSHGFTVNGVQTSGMVVDFSGTAGQVHDAFGTEIHNLDVGGVRHIANMSDPRIPAALSGLVRGVVSLHDFRPHTNFKSRPAYTFTSSGETFEAVVPADLAKIYNLTPLFKAGISGQGQTIVLIEDTDVYSTADWTKFRSTFGLDGYTSGALTQVHPAPATGKNNCSDPGVLAGNEEEAELDVEWASAAAPSATTELASCSDGTTTFGGLIALENLVNSPAPPAIVSISYGECEPENGATANAAYNTTYQQADALGTSVFVSSGDEGAASCDADQSSASHGISVSGFASTPYNVAVGGTDFGDTYAGTNSTYWKTKNTKAFGSAKSYIPEIPWNDSCASVLISTLLGYSTPYGSAGACNSTSGENFLTTASGSGGPSGCATGLAVVPGEVGGTCKGYAKPSWQSLVGVPADGVRDIPDVSLFAANGVFGHYYVFCDSDASDGATCSGVPSTWSGAGGTSFASPIMAAIQSLVDQKTGSLQGNPNPVYYALAAKEYGASGSSKCNSTSAVGACMFHDITLGDIDVNCTGLVDCYTDGATNGVLSVTRKSYEPAYTSGTGWDFATGIGSVNAYLLVTKW